MHVPHPFGLAGLLLSTVGALALLRFSGKPFSDSPLTEEQQRSMILGIPKLRRHYRIETWGYRASVIAIAGGFVLQAVDLTIA